MPSGVSQVASSTPRPVVSLNALAQSSAAAPAAGRPSSTEPKSGIPLMPVTPSCSCTVRRTSRASQPANTYPSTPSTPRSGLPASHTWRGAGLPQLRGQRRRRRRRSPCRCRRCRRPSSPPRRSPSTPSPDGVSSPPAWNRLPAKRGAGGVPGDRPDRGQVDPGGRSAAASAAVAQLLELLRGAHPGQPAGAAAPRRRARGRAASRPRFGNSLTPVIASVAVRQPLRPARPRRRRSGRATRPESSAATSPPARSISVNQSHAAWARESVSDSTYQEPPAGSSTRARCPSSTSRLWVLRAIRREKASGRPERGVERLHGDDVGAAHARGEAGDRRPQHVHPRVALRRHHRRGDRVLPLGARVRARRR